MYKQIKLEDYSDKIILEPKPCIFCPSKLNVNLSTVKQHHNFIWNLCAYCSLIKTKIFEQINKPESGGYFCSYCTVNGLKFEDLVFHLQDHCKLEPCVCLEDKGQNNIKDIKIDIKEEEPTYNHDIISTQANQTTMSFQCEFKASEHSNFNGHKRKCKVRIHCYQCEYRTNIKSNLVNHKQISVEKPFNCEQCEYKTNRKYNLVSHKQKHSSEKPFHCDQCEYKTVRSSTLQFHKQKHVREKLFDCEQCEYKTNSKYNLECHEKIHTGEKTFHCDQCEFKTSKRSDLYWHKRKCKQQFHCHQCEYRTNLKNSLETHKRRHTGEKPFLCDRCDFKSANSNSFRIHKQKHPREKPFHCDQCEYKTAKSSTFQIHIKRKHAREKLFNCEQCEYKTNRKYNLKSHEQIHMGEKPSVKPAINLHCDQCEFKTSERSHLNWHKIKCKQQFHCDQCEYRTNIKNSLKTHKRRHTGEKPFICDQCDFKSAQSSSLQFHKRKHAREKQLPPMVLHTFVSFNQFSLKLSAPPTRGGALEAKFSRGPGDADLYRDIWRPQSNNQSENPLRHTHHGSINHRWVKIAPKPLAPPSNGPMFA